MKEQLPVIYISTLLIILILALIFVIKEVVKTRKSENSFSKLQKKLNYEATM